MTDMIVALIYIFDDESLFTIYDYSSERNGRFHLRGNQFNTVLL